MWYQQGLPFKCTQCGQCCTGFPGYTWVSDQEIEDIAAHLNISPQEFVSKYLRKVDGRWSLKEKAPHYDCVFLKDKKCQIYPVRPRQCRTFPWWVQNLQTPEAWKEATKRCEGIDPNAPVVPYEKIQHVLEGKDES